MNNGLALGYDAAGNVTSDGINAYQYDAEGRLCAVDTTKNVNSANPGYIGYIYDAAGTRVGQTTSQPQIVSLGPPVHPGQDAGRKVGFPVLSLPASPQRRQQRALLAVPVAKRDEGTPVASRGFSLGPQWRDQRGSVGVGGLIADQRHQAPMPAVGVAQAGAPETIVITCPSTPLVIPTTALSPLNLAICVLAPDM